MSDFSDKINLLLPEGETHARSMKGGGGKVVVSSLENVYLYKDDKLTLIYKASTDNEH